MWSVVDSNFSSFFHMYVTWMIKDGLGIKQHLDWISFLSWNIFFRNAIYVFLAKKLRHLKLPCLFGMLDSFYISNSFCESFRIKKFFSTSQSTLNIFHFDLLESINFSAALIKFKFVAKCLDFKIHWQSSVAASTSSSEDFLLESLVLSFIWQELWSQSSCWWVE